MPTRAERLAELEAQRAAIEAEDDDEPETEYEIGRGENYARVSSKSKAGRKIKGFFKESFGIDLDDEPVQELEPEAEPKKERAPGRGQAQAGGQVKAFQRRIS